MQEGSRIGRASTTDGHDSEVNRQTEALLIVRYFRRPVMHRVLVGPVSVSLQKNQRVQRGGVSGVLARVLVLGGRAGECRNQADVDVVAVEIRARLLPRDFDPKIRLPLTKLSEERRRQADDVGRQLGRLNTKLAKPKANLTSDGVSTNRRVVFVDAARPDDVIQGAESGARQN